MMRRGRYVVALGLAAIALAPITARPALDVYGREVVAGRSYPDTWPEIKRLDEWNPVPFTVTLPDGTTLLRPTGKSFGWFCYQTFVDPGPIWGAPLNTTMGSISVLLYSKQLSEELHDYFSVLAAACQDDPTFGGALKLLFESTDDFNLKVQLYPAEAPMGALLQQQRARSLEVAKAMRQVMASKTARRETKAAAHLIVGLTEGDECSVDTRSTRQLARIPDLYSNLPIVGFLSQYYLANVLDARDKQSEAQRVTRNAVKKYSAYPLLRDLAAYRYMTTPRPHDGWDEIEALDAWNPSRFVAAPDGSRASGRDEWSSHFGWFCYQTFVDPGGTYYVVAGSRPWETLHQYYGALASACMVDPSFGSGLKLLFEHVHLFGRSVPFYGLDVAKLGPLSAEQRATLREVARAMREVMTSRTAKPEVRAAAHLIVALTEGNEFPRDTVSTRQLGRISALYPSQPIVGFLSEYYLYRTLLQRGMEREALRIAGHLIEQYSDRLPVDNLPAYRDAQYFVALHWGAASAGQAHQGR